MDGDDDVWSLDQGVCSECLLSICKKLNISCYGFDVTKKCFIKNVAPSRNYPVLVYYSVNQHMYWITDQAEVQSLVKRARDIEVNIKSELIKESPEEKGKKAEKKNIYKELPILENIPISELENHRNCIIIYSGLDEEGYCKTNLNKELDQIIEQYNYIPDTRKMKYQKFKCTRIPF